MTKIVQFIAIDSLPFRANDIVQSRDWVKRHLEPKYEVKVERFRGLDGYWNALMDYWNKGDDLIIIEQDMMPLQMHIRDMLKCDRDCCTVPYQLRDGSLSVYQTLEYMNFNGVTLPSKTVRKQMPTSDAIASGLGLVKFTERAQRMIPLWQYPVQDHNWSLIDSWISAVMDLSWHERWHVHYPAAGHLHSDR